jgi:hypothetical protein
MIGSESVGRVITIQFVILLWRRTGHLPTSCAHSVDITEEQFHFQWSPSVINEIMSLMSVVSLPCMYRVF